MTRLGADWLTAPDTTRVCAALTAEGARLYFVGGCVRNALLGCPVADLDLATDAHPDTVIALAARAGLRSVAPGLAHGTVTVLSGGQPFEVTTFRRDLETDGRRATIAFSTDIAEDAARRDFTMNALYATPDGALVDPLGGLPDLTARRLRFVGDPERRITEDYLRILRFFRFHAWYADPEGGFDAEGLAACAALQDGLARLSRERIGAEITKLLSAPDPSPAVAAMAATGILAHVLPGADPSALGPLVHFESAAHLAPSWHRRLSALGGPIAERPGALRLAKSDAKALRQTAAALDSDDRASASAYRFGPAAARDAALIRAASLGTPPPATLEADIARGATARFPLRAADLSLTGPSLGTALRQLEDAWIASDFTLTAETLRAR